MLVSQIMQVGYSFHIFYLIIGKIKCTTVMKEGMLSCRWRIRSFFVPWEGIPSIVLLGFQFFPLKSTFFSPINFHGSVWSGHWRMCSLKGLSNFLSMLPVNQSLFSELFFQLKRFTGCYINSFRGLIVGVTAVHFIWSLLYGEF